MAASGLGLGWLWGLGLKGAGDRQRWRRERQLKNNERQYQRLTISDCCGWYDISFVKTPDSGGDWPWIELSLISKLLLPRLISPVCGSRSWLLACWTVIQTKPRLVIRLTTVMFCVISKKKWLPSQNYDHVFSQLLVRFVSQAQS